MKIRPFSLQKSLVGIIILLTSKAIGSSSWISSGLARNYSLLFTTMTPTSPRRSQRLTMTTVTASTALESNNNSKINPEAVPSSAADSTNRQQQQQLFQDWMDHDEASFHHFSPETAETIRSALLEWYTGNRRKLPWRGDPPPYDGSTAGINNGKRRAKDVPKKELDTQTKKQANITNFFAATTSATTTKSNNKKDEEKQNVLEPQEAIPMTGYGVWVSEIMLQQTRVEAVIPYWLKCK
jgi:A/G-specific adenine glycosylase